MVPSQSFTAAGKLILEPSFLTFIYYLVFVSIVNTCIEMILQTCFLYFV